MNSTWWQNQKRFRLIWKNEVKLFFKQHLCVFVGSTVLPLKIFNPLNSGTLALWALIGLLYFQSLEWSSAIRITFVLISINLWFFSSLLNFRFVRSLKSLTRPSLGRPHSFQIESHSLAKLHAFTRFLFFNQSSSWDFLRTRQRGTVLISEHFSAWFICAN